MASPTTPTSRFELPVPVSIQAARAAQEALGYTVVLDYSKLTAEAEKDEVAKRVRILFSGNVNHVVQSGETTTQIARDHLGLAKFEQPRQDVVYKIALDNRLPSIHKVKEGTALVLPGMPAPFIDPKSTSTSVFSPALGPAKAKRYIKKIVGPRGTSAGVAREVYKGVSRLEAGAVSGELLSKVKTYQAGGAFSASFDYTHTTEDSHVPLLTAQQSLAIRNWGYREKRRSAWLFVVDTGWPDPSIRQNSLGKLREVLDAAWRRLDVTFQKDRKLRPDSRWVDLDNRHCKYIAESLDELVELDAKERVTVVYVPVGRTQGADLLLVELATLGELLPVLPVGSVKITRANFDEAYAKGQKIVSSMLLIGPENKVDINQTIICGLTSAFALYAEEQAASRPIGFLNLSWTVPGNKHTPLGISPGFPGVIVAAAGNQAGRDFVRNADDYARRAGGNDDTVAVVNIRGQNLDTTSSSTTHPGARNGKLVGYYGEVRKSIYGTSFAAPRVAWFLAFAECLRLENISDDEWSYHQKLWLQAARQPISDANVYLFSPLDYLKKAAGP